MRTPRLRKTYLLERTTTRLQLHTESSPLVKGALLLGIIAFFLLSQSGVNAAPGVRIGIVLYCFAGFLVMGNRTDTVIDSEEKRISTERSFYFIKKQQRHPFGDCKAVTAGQDSGRSRLVFHLNDGSRLLAGVSSDPEELSRWKTTITGMIGLGD